MDYVTAGNSGPENDPDTGRREHHNVNAGNQLVNWTIDPDPNDPNDLIGSAVEHDAGGNITDDGHRHYKYDALSRLTAVEDGLTGEPLAAYRYDALGRRCLKFDFSRQDPATGFVPRELYYFDGDRVVQVSQQVAPGTSAQGDDSLDDPPAPPPPPPPPPSEKRIASAEATERRSDDATKQTKLVSGDASNALTAAPKKQFRVNYSHIPEYVSDTPPPAGWYIDEMRQFVYGFDYIDEQVAQIMPDGDRRFVLQDANYNVVGIVSEGGKDLIRQFSYEPYGQLIAVEIDNGSPITGGAINESWHDFQGRWRDPLTGLIYYRGRWYNPTLGRFLQRDPNGLALALADNLAMNGQTKQAFASFDAWAQYADGPSPYQFLRSNPGNHSDPSGMFSYVELATTTGIQAALGGMINGLVSKFAGGGFLRGFAEGAAGGALGGGFAFAASRFGFIGKILFSEIAEGVAESVAHAAVQGDSLTDALVQGAFNGSINLATGGVLGAGVRRLGNPRVLGALESFGAQGGRGFKPFTKGNFRENMARYWGMEPPAGYDAHHVFPWKNHEAKFRKAGINPHNPIVGAWWEESAHRANAGRYDLEWETFFEQYQNPTAEQVLEYGRNLAKKYDFSVTF